MMLTSSLSQQYPDLPVLGSLLAGLLLPVHDVSAESHDDASSTTSTLTSRSCGPTWTPSHLLPITHGLRAGASVAEICERLQELDEISKRHVDILEHFVVMSDVFITTAGLNFVHQHNCVLLVPTVKMFQNESWKLIYFGVKGQGQRVTKTLPAWVFAL